MVGGIVELPIDVPPFVNLIAGTPLGRFGQPDDIARIAVFLASDDSAWLTGERLTASGGYR